MNAPSRESAWRQFLTRFYAAPNELEPAEGTQSLLDMVAQAQTAWLADTSTPCFLPAKIGHVASCYVICPGEDRDIWVRDLIRAYLGSWIEFDGVDSSPGGAPLDGAVTDLIGSRGCRYVFTFPTVDDAPREVLEGIRRLTTALSQRPQRSLALSSPPGRLISNFWDACAAGSEATARYWLDALAGDPRVSRTNGLFLRLQALATFEHWDQIEDLDQFPDLLRMDRPLRVSDALAQLAIARLPPEAALDVFDQHKARYGALVESVAAIRSTAGAQYYTYWCLSAGESPDEVRGRLLDAGWLERVQQSSVLNELLPEHHSTPQPSGLPLDRTALGRAIADGRLDAAINVIAAASPTADALGILGNLVLRTLSPQALSVLQRWRDVLGDVADDQLPGLEINQAKEIPRYLTFDEAVRDAFAVNVTDSQREHAMTSCREMALAALMRPGALPAFTHQVREYAGVFDLHAGGAIDLLLDIERDLYTADVDHPLQELRFLIIETWAYSDESGDRHRTSRIVVLLDRLLAAGVSVKVYDEVVELLRGAWSSYLTDSDTALGLETIEILAASKPDASTALNAFALPVLSRIGEHNARRLEPSTLDAATILAPEFDIAFAPIAIGGDHGDAASSPRYSHPPDDTYVAIYSRMESAATRTKQVLKERFPNIRVEIFNDKVATDPLKSAGRNADVVVIADRAAAHAATNALLDARAGRPVAYARGKGTASLLEAVDGEFQRLLGDRPVPAS